MHKSDYIKDSKDKRDYRFKSPKKPLPLKFQHELDPFVDVGYILACVPAAFTTVNSWQHNSDVGYKLEEELELSWRYLYANVEHIRGGSRFRDSAAYLRHLGQVKDKEMPQDEFHKAENQYQELDGITEEMKKNALEHRIDKYYYVKRRDLKQAVALAPVIIGLRTDRYWNDYRQKVIRYRWWLRHIKHAVVVYGWTPRYWLIMDNRGKKKRKLSLRYPILKRIFITKYD